MGVDEPAVHRLLRLRQHEAGGHRAPHKPLLVLLALGQLARTGMSELPWSVAEGRLADLIAEYGPASTTGRAQSAAYPFTHLRSDGVWVLDHDVPMDRITPLRDQQVTGRLEEALERELASHPDTLVSVARSLVDAHFPSTVARDVLVDAGLDPDQVYASETTAATSAETRRRSVGWRLDVLEAWDRQCAFCGFDGLLAGASVGLEAAHVRWFNHEGPDDLDNGLALCSLHHKLLDRGVLGVSDDYTLLVSASFTARTPAGRAVYDLHGRALAPRPGTQMPADRHVRWHRREVFKGDPVAA